MWLRIDDGFNQHPKVLSIPRARRAGALALWMQAAIWCAGHTDGAIPSYLPDEYGLSEYVPDLIAAGLWEVIDTGWMFHDWLVYNPPRDNVALSEKRAEAGRRGAAARWGKQHSGTAVAIGCQPDDTGIASEWQTDSNPMANNAPVPVPVPLNTFPSAAADAAPDQAQREDVEALCSLLADRIATRAKRPAITARWRTQCRLLLDTDGRTPDEVRKAIMWLETGSKEAQFWMGVVLSMPQLREKFDTMKLRAQQERGGARAGPPRNGVATYGGGTHPKSLV